MNIVKILKDKVARKLSGESYIPESLFTYSEYFRNFHSINFTFHTEGGVLVAVSTDFKYGSIVTSGKSQVELDKNIKDAILTSFEIPSVYADKINLQKAEESDAYAPA